MNIKIFLCITYIISFSWIYYNLFKKIDSRLLGLSGLIVLFGIPIYFWGWLGFITWSIWMLLVSLFLPDRGIPKFKIDELNADESLSYDKLILYNDTFSYKKNIYNYIYQIFIYLLFPPLKHISIFIKNHYLTQPRSYHFLPILLSIKYSAFNRICPMMGR